MKIGTIFSKRLMPAIKRKMNNLDPKNPNIVTSKGEVISKNNKIIKCNLPFNPTEGKSKNNVSINNKMVKNSL